MQTPDVVELGRGGGVLDCFVVPWDTAIFGFPVADIRRFELGEGQAPADALTALDDWCAEEGVRLASCRLDHARLRESMALEDAGFRFGEMVHVPHFADWDRIGTPTRRIDVSEATADDLASVQAIAASAFTTGRFLLDWRLPAELSHRRYAAWVRSSFESSGQNVLKAEVAGELVGFFIVERRPDNAVYWHLTAISPGFQGQGYGLSLWLTMLARHRAEGAIAVETTISGHNTAALSLYSRLGFSFTSAQMTFHRLSDRAAVEP